MGSGQNYSDDANSSNYQSSYDQHPQSLLDISMSKYKLNTSTTNSDRISRTNSERISHHNEEPQNEGDLRKKFRLMCNTPRRLLVRFYTKTPKDQEDYDPL